MLPLGTSGPRARCESEGQQLRTGGDVRVVDQIIEYTREQGLLSADDLARLTALGFVREPAPAGEHSRDGRWTERHWEGFTCEDAPYEDGDGEGRTAEPDETETAIQASRSGRRSQGGRRGTKWKGRRARRVRRALARAWRQPGSSGGKTAVAAGKAKAA